MKKPAYFTKEGHDELKNEYEELKKKRDEAVIELKRARELGDLSENAAYKVARSRLSGIDRRLRFLESTLKKAQVVKKRTDGFVGIGSTLILKNIHEEIHFVLVDGYESDISKGKISTYSPIGRAVFGKKKNDVIFVKTPKGVVEYTIIKVV